MPRDDPISRVMRATSELIPLAQASLIYRASLAYILQQLRSVTDALKPLRQRELSPPEVQAVQRFRGMIQQFAETLPTIGKEWSETVLSSSCTFMHRFIDGMRGTLRDVCRQLSLDADQVMKFDPAQDLVNKQADLRELKMKLQELRDSTISCPNSVDIHQQIQLRMQSIDSDLPADRVRRMTVKVSRSEPPSTEVKLRMERELAVFSRLDIATEDLRIEQPIGSGGFGTVFRAVSGFQPETSSPAP
jgi:hypothetical protein